MNQLVVIGQGYVGLSMAVAAAEAGLQVVGLDESQTVVRRLNNGSSHITDVSDERLRAAQALGYRATADPVCICDADVVLVCVPTPLNAEGGPDLRAVLAAAEAISRRIREGALVVLESTTYPGTTEELFAPTVLGQRWSPGDVNIAYSPERVDPGNALFDVRNTPKVVGGLTEKCTLAACEFYSLFVDTVVTAKSAREAEMTKLLENTFRHVNIALINEMARFSHEMDIDLWNAIECAASKPFGYMPFWPGPGVGGHCIPVDPAYLGYRVRAELGYSFRMVELAAEINKAAPLYVARRAWEALNRRKIAMNGARVLLLGVTYKANVSDCRESPAAALAKRLLEWGADLHYHDPFAPEWPFGNNDSQLVLTAPDVYDAAHRADMVILLQAHDCYDLDKLAETATTLLDTRGVMPPRDWVEYL